MMFRFVSAMFGLPGSRVWWGMIQCHLFFLICRTSDAIQGHISFRMRFIDHEGVACLSLFARCMQGWWYIRYPRDDSLVEPIESHLASCRHRWFELIWFFDMLHFRHHTGAYSPFRSRCGDPPLICMIIPSYEIHVRLLIRFHFVLILQGASLESFSQILTLWYNRCSWTKLCRVLGFPRHHFSGVRVRPFTHPHDVVLGSSRHIGYIWCHTGAYFPHLAMEAIVLSHIRYSFHHSAEIYCIRLIDHYSWALHRYELSAEHCSRLVESLSAISSGLRFAAACHTGAYPHLWVHRMFCRSFSLLSLFLDFCESSYWGIPL